MQTLILLCTLAAVIGFPLGYLIGWAWDEAQQAIEATCSAYCWYLVAEAQR